MTPLSEGQEINEDLAKAIEVAGIDPLRKTTNSKSYGNNYWVNWSNTYNNGKHFGFWY